jgi:hypothetical protein
MMKIAIRLYGFLIIISLLFLMQLQSMAQEPFGIHRVGRLYNSFQSGGEVVIRNNLCFVNSGKTGLHIFDLADPAQITPVGYYDDFRSTGEHLDVQGNLVYMTTGYGGLLIVDVTDPENPDGVSSFCADRLFAADVKVVGNLVYLICRGPSVGTACLQILNIDNPHDPQLVSQLELERIRIVDSGKQRLIVSENICYVIFDQIMYLIDIANPESPDIKSSIDVPGIKPCFILHQDLIITGHWNGIINFYDVSNAEEPSLLNTIDRNSYILDLGIQDSLLFLTTSGRNVHVLDISDLENPEDVFNGGIAPGSCIMDITEDYLLTVSSSLATFDFSNPRDIIQLDSYVPDQIKIYNSYIMNDRAFVGDSPGRYDPPSESMVLVDIENPSQPQEIDRRDSTIFGSIELLEDDLLYFLRSDLYIYDITDYQNWELISRNETVEYEQNMTFEGNRVYLNVNPDRENNGRDGISVMDISNPREPEEISFIGELHGIIKGDYLFSIDGTFKIYDISNPDRILEVGFNVDYESYVSLTLSDDLLSVSVYNDFDQRLIASFDVSNPYDPILINEIDLTYKTLEEMIIHQEHLITAFVKEGIYIYDFSDRESGRLVGYCRTPGEINDIAVSGNYIYVADETNFGIYDFSEALGVTISKPMFPETTFINTFYPNPFNDRGVAEFYLHKSGMVSLSLHSITGRQVENLIPLSGMAAGWHSTNFNAKGRSTGTYFLKYDIDGQFYTEPILLLK